MFAKIFKTMFYGSLTAQPDPQLVFVCLLTHADRDGNVELPAQVIAAVTGLGPDRVAAALALLEATDPVSRSGELEGRRIEPTGPGRWSIVNYVKYRATRDDDERRRQGREAAARFRAKSKGGNARTKVETNGQRKPRVSQRQPLSAQAEGEVGAEAKTESCDATHRADLLKAHGVEPASDEARALDLYLGLEPVNEEPYANASRAALLATPDWRDVVGAVPVPQEILDQAQGNKARALALLEAAGRGKSLNGSEAKVRPDRSPGAKTGPPRIHVGAVYEISKKLGKEGQARTLQITNRLFNAGIRHPAVLNAVARHFVDHYDGIRNPFAYYSPGAAGFDFIRAKVGAEHAQAEAQILERATKDWLSLGAIEGDPEGVTR
jgi:hypothetical protein